MLLDEFAPEFAHFNDDVLFGENWNNQDIDLKDQKYHNSRGVNGFRDHRFLFEIYHLQNAKAHGVTQKGNRSYYHSRCFLCQAGQKAGQFLTWQKRYGM